MNILTLINAAQVFNQNARSKISPKLAYKIMKFCKQIAEDEKFYLDKRNEIIMEYAARDEEGQLITGENDQIKLQEDKIAEAEQALRELNALEVEAPSVGFTLEELEELKLSVFDMFMLDALIIQE